MNPQSATMQPMTAISNEQRPSTEDWLHNTGKPLTDEPQSVSYSRYSQLDALLTIYLSQLLTAFNQHIIHFSPSEHMQ
jgi:hypothetical protein